MDAIKRWVLGGVLLLGSPFAAVGISEGLDTRAQLQAQSRAVASVVANQLQSEQRDGVEERAYYPQLRFHTADGSAHLFTDKAGSLPPDYQPGEQVEVSYDTAHPAQARIVSWKRLWLVPCLLTAVGLVPFLVALLVLTRL